MHSSNIAECAVDTSVNRSLRSHCLWLIHSNVLESTLLFRHCVLLWLSMLREILDSVPLWGVMLATFVLIMVTVEIGFRAGQYRRKSPGAEDGSQVNSLTGAHLALLAFMMGFSFNMAANHHYTRKMIILDETNAIGTAYLRAGLVDSAQGDPLRQMLADYVGVRATINDPGVTPASVIIESEALQDQMWLLFDDSPGDEQISAAERILLESLNEVFDLHQERVYAGMRTRIPVTIWLALAVVTITAMTGMGYNFGVSNRRSPLASMVLALSFAVVIYLISDLDRPGVGYMQPDDSTIMELNNKLHETGGIDPLTE